MDLNMYTGAITEPQVKEIRTAYYADGVIDADEFEAFGALLDRVQDEKNHHSFRGLAGDIACSFLLDDENTPNELDPDELHVLRDQIFEDGTMNKLEAWQVLAIKAAATKLADGFEALLTAALDVLDFAAVTA